MASEEKKDASFSQFKKVSEAEKQQIMLDRNCKSTQQKTQQSVKLFQQFLLETGCETTFEQLTDEQLADALENFYVSLQQKNGEEYKL